MYRSTRIFAYFACALTAFISPVHAAAETVTVQQQLATMQRALEVQQAQLAAQQHEIEAQRAEINALLGQLPAAADTKPDPAIEQQQAATNRLEQVAAQSKLSSEDQPKLSFADNRPTLTSADGHSSIALRALVQLDVAHYAQSPPGTLSTDFRRGSVGASPNRDTDAARELSDGAFFRRARTGVEGVINSVFNYRFITDFGSSAGTEGPARVNDASLAYTGLAPFTFQFGAFSPPANLDDDTAPDDLLFIERPSSVELSRSLAGGDGRTGFGVRYNGTRGMG